MCEISSDSNFWNFTQKFNIMNYHFLEICNSFDSKITIKLTFLIFCWKTETESSECEKLVPQKHLETEQKSLFPLIQNVNFLKILSQTAPKCKKGKSFSLLSRQFLSSLWADPFVSTCEIALKSKLFAILEMFPLIYFTFPKAFCELN